MQPETKTKNKSERLSPWIKFRLVVVGFFILVEAASVIALGPCIAAIQRNIFMSTTDCGKVGDCDARAAKRNGLSGSLRGFGGVLLAAPYGVMTDKYGRRPILVASTLIPLLTLPLLLGSPGSITPFYVVNALVGLLPRAAFIQNIIIIDLTTPDNRFKWLSYYSMGMMIIALIATGVSSAVVNSVGEQGILQCSVLTTLIEAVVHLVVFPETATFESAEEENGQMDNTSNKTEVDQKKRKQTSNNIADVLVRSRGLDDDHLWEFKAFWLYVLCQIPDAMMGVVMPFLMHDLYNMSTADYGEFTALAMLIAFFWLSAGMRLFDFFLKEKARILQACIALSTVGNLWLIFGISPYTPMLSSCLAGAVGLVPLILKTLILNVTAEHRQGKIMGFLAACDAILGVIAPSLGSAVFAWGQSIGWPRFPWFMNIAVLQPLAIYIAQYTFFPEAMPPNLQVRLVKDEEERLMGI